MWRGATDQALFAPHSGQNFAADTIFAPHWPHSSRGRRLAPHSGQNFPPCVCALHFGQRATIWPSRSSPLVWSLWRVPFALPPPHAGGGQRRRVRGEAMAVNDRYETRIQ
jgi:hypothetical protein